MPHGARSFAPASIPSTRSCACRRASLASAIRGKAVSCVETMRAYLDHVERVNGAINAIVALRDRDALLAEAAEKDAALARGEYHGWMHGMPQAPKDLAMTKGLRTTYGSPIFRENVPQTDSVGVARMRAAGAIFIGKTNTPEFAGSHTFNEVYGATRNPYDLTKSAGGSSGGTAAALASRMLPVADGSDFGGSLRNPAAFCNIYGFRPSQAACRAGRASTCSCSSSASKGRWAVRSATSRNCSRSRRATTATIRCRSRTIRPCSRSRSTPTCAASASRGRRLERLSRDRGACSRCASRLATLREIGCDVDAALPAFAPDRIWRQARAPAPAVRRRAACALSRPARARC